MPYKKPPVKNQFQPGQSGNPKGRPKSFLESKTVITRRILDEPIEIKELGETRITTTKIALVKSIASKARKGDPTAIKLLSGCDDASQNDLTHYNIFNDNHVLPMLSLAEVLDYIDEVNIERAKEGLPALNFEDLIEEV